MPHTKGLNLAFGRGDGDETVTQNLKIFADAVGFDAESVISVPQIHSSTVMTVDASHRGMGYFKPAPFECDGYVTADKSTVLGVKTADCVPILLSAKNENGEVIAIGALHAGWRGTANGIAREGVKALVAIGAEPARIYAAIGPHISQAKFEVGEDCRDEFLALLGEDIMKFIEPRGEKFFPDLGGINKMLLESCGVLPENIEVSCECTYSDTSLFYSHRKSGGLRGTHLSIIGF